MTKKRVLPFTLQKVFFKKNKGVRRGGKRAEASITVEAALSLPLFVFFVSALIQPIYWLDRQRQIQTMMENVCEELSQYAYIEKELRGSMEERDMEEGYEWEVGETADLYGMISETAGGLWLRNKVNLCAEDAEVIKSEIHAEQENLRFEVEYRERIPFFYHMTNGIRMCVSVRRRMWIGLDGKLKEADIDYEEIEGNGNLEWVYVGAGMGRYHLYRDCHYISNQYETVSISQAIHMKNSYGAKLTACGRCEKSGENQEKVYITKEGEHYHYSQSCSAMTAYVRKVPKKEVEYLGMCSYCMRREKKGEER